MKKMKNMLLSIIIINYKSDKLVENLRKKLTLRNDWEFIVITNSANNKGYGAACNEGAKKARGQYLLFLNADIEIPQQSIEKMISVLSSHPKIGVVGPQLRRSSRDIEKTSSQRPTFFISMIVYTLLHRLPLFSRLVQQFWYKTWDRTTSRFVDAVSGAAMLVRADDFRRIGQFDESFFLYWEEYDLCARMLKIGKKVWYEASAPVIHLGGGSTNAQDPKIEKYFKTSRFLFFRKHIHVCAAIFLEVWFFFLLHLRECILVILAMFLALYRVDQAVLLGDQGRDYLYALSMVQEKEVPLLGIPSSIPRFSQGPLNIWFAALSFVLFGHSVFSPIYLSAILFACSTILLYRVISSYSSKMLSFVTTLLFVTALGTLQHVRSPFYLHLVPFFTLLFISAAVSRKKTALEYVVLGLAVAGLFQSELATLPLLFSIPMWFLLQRIRSLKYVLGTFAGFIVGLFPQILFDLSHRCLHLCTFGTWIGYRLFATTGFDGRHAVSIQSIGQTVIQTVQHLSHLMFHSPVITVFVLLFLLAHLLIAKKKKRLFPAVIRFSILCIVLLCVGFIVHQSPSESYMPPFFVLLPILIAYVGSQLSKKLQFFFVLIMVTFVINQVVQSNRLYQSREWTTIQSMQSIVREQKQHGVRSEDDIILNVKKQYHILEPQQFETDDNGFRFLWRIEQ